VLTFTRASSATCTKTRTGGLATTGIANGDLVVLTSNQPRIEYDSDGTLGLLVESSRTNDILRSQELDNAAWATVGTAMTITQNFATAPDGTTTAERLEIPATSGAGLSLRAQTGLSSAVRSGSCYVKGNGTSGTLDIYQSGASVSCGGCPYNSTTWTRCALISGAAVTTFHIGNDSLDCASAARGAADVLVWGCQSEAGTYATSYIPTTSAAVTRAVESASFDGLSISSANGLSWAATVWHPSGNGGGVWAAGANLVQDASNRTQLYRANTNVQNCDYFSTSGNRSVGTVISAYVAGQAYRQACSYSGAGASSTVSGYRDGTLTGTSAAGLTSAWTATSVLPGALGAAATTGPADGVVSRICIDPSPIRCR